MHNIMCFLINVVTMLVYGSIVSFLIWQINVTCTVVTEVSLSWCLSVCIVCVVLIFVFYSYLHVRLVLCCVCFNKAVVNN